MRRVIFLESALKKEISKKVWSRILKISKGYFPGQSKITFSATSIFIAQKLLLNKSISFHKNLKKSASSFPVYLCRVLQFRAHSRYYKGALTQKRSFLVICTTFRSDFCVSWKNQNKHSTLNLSFDALFKWHEPDIRRKTKTDSFVWFMSFGQSVEWQI